jgi:hypothetical protein
LFIIDPKSLSLGDPQKFNVNVMLDVGRAGLLAPETRVRLVIYDFELYDAFNQQQATAADGDPQKLKQLELSNLLFVGGEQPPSVPPRRLLTLPPELLSPQPQAGNGVLAVADFKLRRVETPAEIESAARFGGEQWYINEVVGSVQIPDDVPFFVGVRMLAKRDDAGAFGSGAVRRQVVFKFGIARKGLQTLSPKRVLAMRLLSPIQQGPLQAGTIILSSLNRLDNRVGKVARFRDRGVSLLISDAKDSLAKPGQPPTPKASPQPASRQVTPDLSGMYELQVQANGVDPLSSEYIAPAALWLSQAGRSIVGWYLPYREIGVGEGFTGKGVESLMPLQRRACLMTVESDKFPLKALMFWCSDTGDERIDADKLIVAREVPDAKDDVMAMLGDFELVNPGPLSVTLKLTFRDKWKLSDIPGEGEIKSTDAPKVGIFRRVRTGVRMPWIAVKQFALSVFGIPDHVDNLVRTVVEPLPEGFSRAVARRLSSPQMAAQIRLFSRGRDKVVIVRGVFEAISDLINSTVGTGFFPSAAYRAQALSAVRTHAGVIRFTGDDGLDQTLEKWLFDIGTAHLSLQADAARAANNDQPLTSDQTLALQQSIGQDRGGVMRDLGVLEGDEFEYEFSFSVLQAAGNLGVGVQFGGFLCTIKRTAQDPKNTRDNYSLQFVGMFAGVSEAFGLKVLIGGASASGSGAPPGCKIRSFLRIDANDWGSALPPNPPLFSVAAVAGGLGLSTAFIEVQTALNESSTMFNIRAPGAIGRPSQTLSAVVENSGDWDFSTADVREIVNKLKDPAKRLSGKLIDIQATVISLSESVGFMVPVASAAAAPDPALPMIDEQTNPLSSTANAPLMGFDKGSSRIEERELQVFERRLALYRYFFEVPGSYACKGFASPEFKESRAQGGPGQANKNLSTDRAKAVDDLIAACFAKPGQGIISAEQQHLAPFGDGRDSSLRGLNVDPPGGGLLDPFKTPAGEKPDEGQLRKTRIQREAEFEYFKWRRVDLVVNATLIARIFGK